MDDKKNNKAGWPASFLSGCLVLACAFAGEVAAAPEILSLRPATLTIGQETLIKVAESDEPLMVSDGEGYECVLPVGEAFCVYRPQTIGTKRLVVRGLTSEDVSRPEVISVFAVGWPRPLLERMPFPEHGPYVEGVGHNDWYYSLSVSGNGDVVAVGTTLALVPNDVNGDTDIYLTSLGDPPFKLFEFPVGYDGEEIVDIYYPRVSGSGEFMAFLAGTPPNWLPYVVELRTGHTEMVGFSENGTVSPGVRHISISDDGRYVATSIQGGTVRDRLAGWSRRVGLDEDGNLLSDVNNVEISGNGRFVVFDTGSDDKIYLHDLQSGRSTQLQSASGDAFDFAIFPSISDDGTRVVFRGNIQGEARNVFCMTKATQLPDQSGSTPSI